MKSLSKGSVYYLIYNVLNVAFPFITGIYVSRKLLPESIGTVAAAQNLAQYFVILAFLGIPTYGLREISKTRNDLNERSIVFSELFVINFISTIVFLSIYLVLILSVPIYRREVLLYAIVGISIALNAFNISWLYEGLEEFQFISIRNLVFKTIAFLLLVIFVRSSKDVAIYTAITVIGTAGNYIVNMIFAPKYVKFTIHGLNLRRHMKSILFLVAVNLAIELYSLVDITMMNFMCDKGSIAFYKYGVSIKKILLQIVNTFTIVLVPRISFYFKEKRFDEYNRLLSKALILIVMISAPMIVGLYFTSDFLMVKLYGESYIESARILKIISVLLLISPIGYLLGSRVLLTTGHENLMIIPVGFGAIINIAGNALLIPRYSGIGAVLASVFSEIIIMMIYVYMGKKHFKLFNVRNSILKILIACFVMGLFLLFCRRISINEWIALAIQVVGAVSIYAGLLLFMKESVVQEYFTVFRMRLNR